MGLGELSLDHFGPLSPFFFSMMRAQDEIVVLKLGSRRPMGSMKKPGEPLLQEGIEPLGPQALVVSSHQLGKVPLLSAPHSEFQVSFLWKTVTIKKDSMAKKKGLKNRWSG